MTSRIATDQRRLDSIVHRATLAPSVHNTQPWRFELGPDALTLTVDRSRQLAVLDPTGRQLMISCGCALLNTRLALAHDDLPVRVRLWPEGEQSSTVARLEFCDPDDPDRDRPADPGHLGVLHAAIEHRRTNRRQFSDQPVAPEVLETLEHAAHEEGAVLTEVHHSDDRMVLAQLAQRADALQNADPAYRAELRAWTINGPDRRDGVPASVVPHVGAESGDEIPIRDFDSQGAGGLSGHTASTRDQCLLLLGTASDRPPAWLAAGQALQRVLLEIAAAGLAVSPLTQVVEVPAVRAELRLRLRLGMHPHVLLRLGYAEATPSTPRRPVEDVFDIRSDQ